MSKVGDAIGSGIGKIVGAVTGSTAAADEARRGSELAAQGKQAELDYLMETEAVPQALREASLKGLGAEYGYTMDEQGNVISDDMSMVERAQQSPLYAAMTGNRAAGEEAIARHAGATGGLRSGNIQENLYDYNVDLENRALLQSYQQQLQGVQGLAQLPSNATAIGGAMSDIGEIRGAGRIAAGQATQAGRGMFLQGLMKAGTAMI